MRQSRYHYIVKEGEVRCLYQQAINSIVRLQSSSMIPCLKEEELVLSSKRLEASMMCPMKSLLPTLGYSSFGAKNKAFSMRQYA